MGLFKRRETHPIQITVDPSQQLEHMKASILEMTKALDSSAVKVSDLISRLHTAANEMNKSAERLKAAQSQRSRTW